MVMVTFRAGEASKHPYTQGVAMGKLPFLVLFAIGWLCMAFYPSCSPRLLVPPAHIADGDAPHTLPRGTASVGLSAESFNDGGIKFFDNTTTGGSAFILKGG